MVLLDQDIKPNYEDGNVSLVFLNETTIQMPEKTFSNSINLTEILIFPDLDSSKRILIDYGDFDDFFDRYNSIEEANNNKKTEQNNNVVVVADDDPLIKSLNQLFAMRDKGCPEFANLGRELLNRKYSPNQAWIYQAVARLMIAYQ